MKKPIYLDFQSTTPIDPRVYIAMKPFLNEYFGNPGSVSHEYGIQAADEVENARALVAKYINANLNEIVFTSGATESNNIAIQGVINHLKFAGKKHLITSAIEHKSVLDVITAFKKNDFEITFLKPNSDGSLNVEGLKSAIRPDTGLVSIMYANNEIGVINPVIEIGKLTKDRGILFHCDATQAIGKLPVDVKEMNCFALSISGHKIYGPKGIGALFINHSDMCKIEPIYKGGGQEQGLRPGTVAPALVVGLSEALKISIDQMIEDNIHIKRLRDFLLNELTTKLTNIKINGTLEKRLTNNLNISFLGIPSDTFMLNLRHQLSVSSGAACTNYEPKASHVLEGLGLEKAQVESAIRFSLGRFTTQDEIEFTVDSICTVVPNLRNKLSKI